MIVSDILVCYNFLICVRMFIVSTALLMSSATVIVRAGGAIWLKPFAAVLCFVPMLRGCVWYVCCYVKKKALLQCLQLLRGGIRACMRCPCLCLCLGFGMGTMLANFHYV